MENGKEAEITASECGHGMERLSQWACRLQGAKEMLRQLDKYGYIAAPRGNKDGNVYLRTLVEWLNADLTHVEAFLLDEPFVYCDHVKDKHGRLISVRIQCPQKNLKE